MICLFVELLFTSVLCESDYEEQTITVTNFHDYSINMKKAGDKLNIILPPNTLIFFSSKEGYEITVGSGPENHLLPDNKRRLYLASKQDIIWVYSTIDNLDFSFHTLCLGKINYKFMETIDRIYISSNPEEYFSIVEKSQVSNGTLHLNSIVWILGNSKIKCNVHQDIKTKVGFPYFSPTYYSFPFDNPEDYNDIDFKQYSHNDDEIEFYSALFAIPKFEDLHSEYNHIFRFSCSPVELADNYYSNYRAYIDTNKLHVSQLIERGEFHLYNNNHIVRGSDDGMIVELDFSIFNTYELLNELYICIFPEVCEMGRNFLFKDQVFLVSHTKEN